MRPYTIVTILLNSITQDDDSRGLQSERGCHTVSNVRPKYCRDNPNGYKNNETSMANTWTTNWKCLLRYSTLLKITMDQQQYFALRVKPRLHAMCPSTESNA